MENKLEVVNATSVKSILHQDASYLKDIIKQTYLAYQQGEAINPGSYFLRYPNDESEQRIIALPAYLGNTQPVVGIKWIASSPLNIKTGLPRASAVCILNEAATGIPFAIIEGATISAYRTALSAILAAETMGRVDSFETVGFVGCGILAETIFSQMRQYGWPIKQCMLYDKDVLRADLFKSKMAINREQEIIIADTDIDVIKNSQVVVLATTAQTPYLDDISIINNEHIFLNISLRDLSPAYILSSNNIVDDVAHILQANTSVHLTYQQVQQNTFITGTLAQLLLGKIKLDVKKPSIFSPMGLGVLDLALATFVFNQAKERKMLQTINGFFDM